MLLAVVIALAAPAGALTVTGDLPSSGSLSIAELGGMAPVSVEWTDHGGDVRHFRAVPLDRVLARFGFTSGPMGKDVPILDKRAGWKKAVVAVAADGFEAVFSCAEVQDGMGPTRAYIAFEADGKPLSAQEGPLRLLVPTDKERSRSVRQLVRLEIVDLRKRAREKH